MRPKETRRSFRNGARLAAGIFLSLLIATRLSHAEGSLSGHVSGPEGVSLAEVRVVLVPESGKTLRQTIKLNKKGDYFFGLVPDGTYTLAFEGTTLVPRSVKLHVYDNEARKDVVNYDGPAPPKPQVFDVKGGLKDTYDVVLGPPDQAAPASPAAQDAALQEVPRLLQSGDYQSALTRLDDALQKKPEDPVLHYYRSFALFKTKDYDKASAELQRTMELNPSQVGVHWVKGAILASQGKKAEAVAEFEKELENPQTDVATRVNSYINIGLIQRELENKDAAIASFEKVLELDNKQSEAYSYLADLYLASGKPDKAAEIQAKSRALGLEDPKIVFNLGANFWNKKEYSKAEESFRRAVELDPKFALAWKSLGYTLVNLGKTTEGAEALGKYLDLAPETDDAKEVRQLLEAIKQK